MIGSLINRARPHASWQLALLLAIGGISCTKALSLGQPSVESIEPAHGPVGEAVSVAIRGEFHLAVTTDLQGDQAEIGLPSVAIGGVPLDNVRLINEERIEGIVPASIPAGTYDVVVTLPDLRQGTLSGGYTVDGVGVDAGVADAGVGDGGSGDGGTVTDPVTMIADDPFGDGTSFSYVAAFDGHVYFGPSANGAAMVRTLPDGTGAESVALAIARDTTGNVASNTSTAPYPSIGATGCVANTAACGPDNENGRGLMASGIIGGTEWLIIGGGRTGGDLDYVYMASSPVAPLAFRYVDISVATGPQTRGFASLHAFGDRLYMGFPDTGGQRPYLIALLAPPLAPGLDAVAGVSVLNLDASAIPGFASTNPASIDAITDFAGRLYIANAGAWARATVLAPITAPADWSVITPSAAAYAAKASVATAKVIDLEPQDRAIPQMAVYQQKLYVARNTTTGPQLWRCDPTLTAPAEHCDAGDWSLIVANTTGDPLLSQFNNGANVAISMLVATPTHLYVGFDNAAQGVVIFRSGAADPMAAADFEGDNGCSASASPTTCEGIGGFGIGSASNTQIFSASALTFGPSTAVYVATGSGATGVKVFRLR